MSQPTTRRAYIFNKQGQPGEVLSQFGPVEIGELDKDEVLVHLKAATLNPLGYKMITALPRFMVKLPAIPEADFSGVIVQVGSKVEDFKIGDEVWGSVDIMAKTGEGVLAEYVKAKSSHILDKKPSNLSWEQAAGLGIAGMTAIQALTEKAGTKKGDRVFVNGGSGGVGMFGVGIAKHLVGPEGKVVSSCSAANIEFVKSLGADEVIDYRSVNLPEYLATNYSSAPFDVIFDTISVPALYLNCEKYLSKHGHFVDIGSPNAGIGQWVRNSLRAKILPSLMGGVSRKYSVFFMSPSQDRIRKLSQLAGEGHFKTVIDSSYRLSDRAQVVKAYERIMSGRAVGKVAVVCDEIADSAPSS